MKLVVLSRSKNIPSTRRLVDAAVKRGHLARVMNPLQVQLFLAGRKAGLLYRRKKIRPPDAVIPRIAASIANYGLPVVDQFAMRGAVVLNTARSIGVSRNPARCLQRLSAAGLDTPATLVARDAADLKALVDRVGGVPVLVKLLSGPERRGVMVCETEQSLEAALEAVLGLGHNLVVQEYVRKADRDVRVFVVGGTALAAVSRKARTGRLSRKLARNVERIALEAPIREVAEKAARLLELEVCAVDMLESSKSGPRVFEVNASPSLPEMEDVTGVDLAGAIIQRAEVLVARLRPMVSNA